MARIRKPTPVPKHARLFGIDISINKVPILDDGANVGEFDETLNAVNYIEGQEFFTERDTILHEFVHAIEKKYQLKMREKQVMMMASGMLELLRNNPQLVKYLCDKNPDSGKN